MPGVTVREYEDVFYSYEEIEEIFGDDPDCLVMQLLKRVKELEEGLDFFVGEVGG